MNVSSMKHRMIGLFGIFIPLTFLGAALSAHCTVHPAPAKAAVVCPISAPSAPLPPGAPQQAQAAAPTPAPAHKPAAG